MPAAGHRHIVRKLLTIPLQVIWFNMINIRPPDRLCHSSSLRVSFELDSSRGRLLHSPQVLVCNVMTSVVWVFGLLLRVHDFDPFLGDSLTVQLLESNQLSVEPPPQPGLIFEHVKSLPFVDREHRSIAKPSLLLCRR